jgi:PAS domain S-box-containing protein
MADMEPATHRNRILIVEDELIIARGIQKRLQGMGYDVIDIVPSGEEAIQSATENPPNLVLMDINLQGSMDGIQAAESIRSRLDLPVIYLTAYTDAESLGRAKVTEPFGYIVKPFQDHTLQSAIEMALYKHRMESRLKNSEQWLATTLRSIGDAVVTTDVSGLVSYMNPVAEELIGLSQEDALGRPLGQLLRYRSEISMLTAEEVVARVVGAGETVVLPVDSVLMTESGKTVPIEARLTPISGGREDIQGMVLVMLDVTEQRRTEQALRRSERILTLKNQIANIFLTTPDGQMFSQVLSVIRDAIDCAHALFGYVDEEGALVVPTLMGEVWQECLIPDKTIRFPSDSWTGLWGRALRERVSLCGDSPCRVPSGHITMENFLAIPVVYRGTSIGLIALANKPGGFSDGERELLEIIADRISPILQARLERDRLERKRGEAAEALATEKERLAVTLRSIGDGVITTDTRGMVVLLNRAAEEMTGWTQEEAAGKPFQDVFRIVNEKSRECCPSPVEQVLADGVVVELANHTLLIARDGGERVIADSGAPIRDRESRLVGVVLVFRDITEKKKMEEELFNARKLDSIGLLAGGIAHDFNNLLTSILGNISLTRMQVGEGDRLRRNLDEAEKASLRAKDLTQQLLTFSRGGAPVRKTVSLAAIIRDSATFTLSGSRATCRFQIPDDLYPVDVDEGQFSQVINNLVLNADQAMPAGGEIEIVCANVTLARESLLPLPAGAYVRISVMDRGEGIPEELVPRIFDPYFTTKKEGKGLGLATVYSIIRNHDGHIGVSSSPGQGTAFTIHLPATVSGRVEAAPEETATTPGRGRILVMDDEESIREVAGEMLSYLGYEVVFARDGAEAVELYRLAREGEHPFSALLMDLTIPGGMGGRDAIALLREMDQSVVAVVSSGYCNDPIMADYRAYGFSGVITKPYRLTELKRVLDGVIARQENPEDVA